MVHEQGSLSAGVTSRGGREDENKPAMDVDGMKFQVERKAGRRIQSRKELVGGGEGWRNRKDQSVPGTQVSIVGSHTCSGKTGRWSQV